MKFSKLIFSLLATVIATLAVLIVLYSSDKLLINTDQQSSLQHAGIITLPKPRPLPKLNFQSTEGENIDTSAIENSWYLVYFGYTYCPDICPTSLAELKHIVGQMPEEVREQLQVLMVTVDPNRDSVKQLRAYLDFFDPDFKGWHGELEDVQTLSSALGIPFIPGDTTQPGYTVDHSGNLAIIDNQGRQFGFIQAPFQINKVAEQLSQLILAGTEPNT